MKKHNQRAEIAALRWIVVRLAASELRRAPLPKRHRGASGVEWRKCTVRRGGVPPSARREAAAKQRVAWSGADIGISLGAGGGRRVSRPAGEGVVMGFIGFARPAKPLRKFTVDFSLTTWRILQREQ